MEISFLLAGKPFKVGNKEGNKLAKARKMHRPGSKTLWQTNLGLLCIWARGSGNVLKNTPLDKMLLEKHF